MTGRRWIKLFKKHNWKVVKITASHYIPVKGHLTEMIAHHTQDIGKKGEARLREKLREGDNISC